VFQTAEAKSRAKASRVILPRRIAASLMALYLLIVGLIVFWPTADVASGSVAGIWSLLSAVGLGWISPTAVEFITNMLLFVPLSFLGHTFRPHWRWHHWLLAGMATTLVIELLQMIFLSGRSAQVIDLAANALGAVVGYWLVRLRARP
jgi:glycopeptide antibiotics resistance protein